MAQLVVSGLHLNILLEYKGKERCLALRDPRFKRAADDEPTETVSHVSEVLFCVLYGKQNNNVNSLINKQLKLDY